MDYIEKRFSVISEPVGCSLLIDEVTSCITGGEIHGTVQARLSVDEALALGRALELAAEGMLVTRSKVGLLVPPWESGNG